MGLAVDDPDLWLAFGERATGLLRGLLGKPASGTVEHFLLRGSRELHDSSALEFTLNLEVAGYWGYPVSEAILRRRLLFSRLDALETARE